VARGYGYGNARLRAMRSRLLSKADYEALLTRTSIDEVITALAETGYQTDIETALLRVGGVDCIFEALRANLTRTLCKIKSFFAGPPQTLIEILLRHWDRHNLLTILRGQQQEISAERVLAAVVPVGLLDQVSLRELTRQPGLRATLDLMTTWRLPYAQPLRQVRARTGTVPELAQLEMALNRFHYASLFKALTQGNGNHAILLDLLKTEVDLVNLRTALRLVRMPEITHLVDQRFHAPDIRPLLIEPGGYLAPQRLARLVAETEGVEMLVRHLADHRYRAALEAGWQRYQAAGQDMARLERALERWHIHQKMAMFQGPPLGIAIAIGYLSSKEQEVANLRLIAQAVALNLARDPIRQDLIVG